MSKLKEKLAKFYKTFSRWSFYQDTNEIIRLGLETAAEEKGYPLSEIDEALRLIIDIVDSNPKYRSSFTFLCTSGIPSLIDDYYQGGIDALRNRNLTEPGLNWTWNIFPDVSNLIRQEIDLITSAKGYSSQEADLCFYYIIRILDVNPRFRLSYGALFGSNITVLLDRYEENGIGPFKRGEYY